MEDFFKSYGGLVFGCPMDNPDANCPLNDMMKEKDIDKRIDIINNMSDDKKREIIDHHNTCTKKSRW